MIMRTLLLGVSVCAMASSLLSTRAGAADFASAVGDQNTQTDADKRRAAKKAEEEAKKKAEAESARKKQSAPTAARTSNSSDADIMVVGVRTSMAAARETKRKSDAIVDVVNAEDIGKLPNNTVGDVLASIPGIGVTRSEGEVNDIQLRGLGGVQTTIGGTPIESGIDQNGGDRVASIADLPADLVKSVEVYKTRTPDQVEGAGGGTININFRDPTDFKGGFTFVSSAQGRFNNQSRKWNQNYTAVINYRTDTSIGLIGAQFGATVNYNPFLESAAFNTALSKVEDRQVIGPNLLPLPTYAPGESAFFYTTGSRKTPSYNASLQWSNESDEVILDGNYATPYFDYYRNELYLGITRQAASTNTLGELSNIVLVPGTNRIQSVTVRPVTQIGPISYVETSKDNNYLGRLRATHDEERFKVYAEIAFTGGRRNFERFETRNRFVNRPTYDVEFASDKFRYPQMNLVFRDLDLLDPNQYRFLDSATKIAIRQRLTCHRKLILHLECTTQSFHLLLIT